MDDLLSQAKASPEFLGQLRDWSKKNLYFFARSILNFDKLTPNFHLPFCNLIQDFSIPRKLVLLPRGHYKTTCGSIGFISWLLIQDNVPPLSIPGSELRILLAKENATLAEHDLSAIEECWDKNELLNLLFPDIVPDKSRRKRWNAEEMLITRESTWPEATVETIGVGGAKQGAHYDVIIFDDIIGKNAMDSEVVMQNTIEWFKYAESLFISIARGISNVLGTRWSKRDVYQFILDKDPRYQPYIRQAVEDGKPIFPEEFSLEVFQTIMQRDLAHWQSQYCNNPTDPTKCDFREEWIKYYEFERHRDRLYVKFDGDDKLVPFSEIDIVGAFDPSIDEKPTASKRAITYWGMDSQERCLMLDCYSSRDSLDKVLDSLFDMHSKWQPRVFGVEKAALQKIFIWIIERESRAKKKYISCTPINVSTNRSKDARIRDIIQPVAAEGRMYVRKSMIEFVQEFIEFPQGCTKDVLDASAYCLQLLRAPTTQEELEAEAEYEEMMLQQRNPVTGY